MVSRGPLSTAEQGEGLNLVEGLRDGATEGDPAVDCDRVAKRVPAMDSMGVGEDCRDLEPVREGDTVGEGVEGRQAAALGMYV